MSGPLALIAAAAASASPSPLARTATSGPPSLTAPLVVAPAPELLRTAISLSIPSTDGGRGGQVIAERWLPERRLSVAASLELRESAIGDYTGVRTAVGAHVRWYWRADGRLSRLPAGSMVGWFVDGGVHTGIDATHDDLAHHWLGTALDVGLSGAIGYRIAPWRQLAITPSAGLEAHHEIDVSGRLPGWNRGGLIVGLEVGWLF